MSAAVSANPQPSAVSPPDDLGARIAAANTEYGDIAANLAHRAAYLRSELAGSHAREQALIARIAELEEALKAALAPAAPPAPEGAPPA
jgi:hypothetical protein